MALITTTLVPGTPDKFEVELLVLATTTDDVDGGVLTSATLKNLDKALNGALSRAVKGAEFTGAHGSELVLDTHAKLPARTVVLYGFGKKARLDREGARHAGSRAVKAGEKAKAASVGLVFPFGKDNQLIEGAAEGAELGAYRFDKYLSDAKPRRTTELALLVAQKPLKGQLAALELGTKLGVATNFARDLVNEPPRVVTPKYLADAAAELAKGAGLKAEILDKKAIEKLDMNLFLGVSQGSEEPPRLIHLWWEPKKKAKDAGLAFVGKAVTFDSGGLSLKPPEGMETMKCDMAGGAACIAAMQVVAALAPPFAVHAYIGATENLPSGTAQKPGDILKGRAGKSVEILNTDAEGRLVLADVLAYAAEQKPEAIIDLATLTGAITIALGPYTCGYYANDDKLAKLVEHAAKGSGESFWRMPLLDELKERIKSPVADLKNTGGRPGGSITAALFLRDFVNGVPWAHWDIAGPAFLDKDKGLDPRGGTGFGVRTLVELVRQKMAK